MYMSLPTLTRTTLFHLILNPLLLSSTRASTALALTNPSTASPSFHNTHQSPNRPFSIFHPQCLASPSNPHPEKPSANMSSSQDPTASQQTQPQADDTKKPFLALPETDSSSSQAIKLDMSEGGSTVKLDHMGPLVVNQDGSLSRISNWDQMAEIEKRNTLRVLGKRNKARLDALKAAGVTGEEKK